MKTARLKAWLSDETERPVAPSLPTLPPIPEAYLNRRGISFLKEDEGELCRRYEGSIEPGMVFAWEPDIPTSRELVVVCEVVEIEGDESRIITLRLDSPMRGRPDRWKAALRHVAGYLFDGAPAWNDESRFREAVVPTMFKPQEP